jgi:hypothetical protein
MVGTLRLRRILEARWGDEKGPKRLARKQEPRIIGLQAREHHEALRAARQPQTTDEFRVQYAARAGIESNRSRVGLA